MPFVSGLFGCLISADPVEVNYLTEIFSLPLLIIPIAAVVLIYLLYNINLEAMLQADYRRLEFNDGCRVFSGFTIY